jgi:AcrR family transcriptional regulator
VLRAALELLADRGLPGFSMEGVAQRAGASKATVYRHWRSPGELLVDAMDLSFRPFPLPATGRLRTDLIELASGLEALLVDQPFPRLLAAFMDAAERDPALQRMHVQLTERRRDLVRHLLARARERGEIPAGTDIELAVDLLAAPAFYRRFVAHQAFPSDYTSAVVDHVLTAIRFAGDRGAGDPAGDP